MALFIEETGVGGDHKNDIYGQSFCLRHYTSLTTTYLKVIIISILQKTTLEVERVLVRGPLTAASAGSDSNLHHSCPFPPQLSQSECD